MLDTAHLDYLTDHDRGRLATVAADGTPQNKPVGYRYNSDLGTIDIAGFDMKASAKYRNVAIHPDVSFVVDDTIGEGATGMRFVEVRGKAAHATTDTSAPGPGVSEQIIRIYPRRAVSWNIGDGPARFQHFNLATVKGQQARPSLGLGSHATEAATAAIASLVEELQAGLDTRDADLYNRHFAQDVIWGSPYGATVTGYDTLHAIHTHLHQNPVVGPSRYEVVQVVTPAAGVAIAHVARYSLDEDGRPIEPSRDPASGFSEMALYVLVRRNRQWWLAAGQNTPIRPGGVQVPGPSDSYVWEAAR
jgi:PPOX class F420-dependent enzyme/OxyR family protein/uncharacterized protein (TIGR02246 family)